MEDMLKSLVNSINLFWLNYRFLLVAIAVVFAVIVICMIIGSILRKHRFNKLEKEIELQRNLIIRAEEDINKLYTDLNALSSHIIEFNNKISRNNNGISQKNIENNYQINTQRMRNSMDITPKKNEAYRGIAKSKSGIEYTIDQLENTIVE